MTTVRAGQRQRVRRVTGWTRSTIATIATTALVLTALVVGAPGAAARDEPAPPPVVEPDDRDSVASAYNEVLLPALEAPVTWDGSIADCAGGTADEATAELTLDAVNVYRALAGLAAVELDAGLSDAAAAAAMVVAANESLSHVVAADARCASDLAAAGALHSNLCLGCSGARAIEAYMRDTGATNSGAGHRRWILYPALTRVGAASTGAEAGAKDSSALYVIDTGGWERAETPEWVAWPPPGFLPYQLTYERFSVSYNAGADFAEAYPGGADFSRATVEVRAGDMVLPAEIQRAEVPATTLPGDAAIVFDVDLGALEPGPGMADLEIEIVLDGVLIDGVTTSYSQTTVVFDPDQPRCLGQLPTIVGTEGDDLLVGTDGPDIIWGGAGHDTIIGGDDRDLLCGGLGRDRLVGGAGNDTLVGGPDKDRLRGQEGRDVLDGGEDDDLLVGGPGADRY